jgi:hypothetical protein
VSAAHWRYVALYGAYVVALHAIDGPWKRWKQGREGKALDPWTLQHVLWGAIAYRMGVDRSQLVALGTANEVVEAGVRTFRPDLLWGTPESPANVIVDVAANWAGWELAKRLSA